MRIRTLFGAAPRSPVPVSFALSLPVSTSLQSASPRAVASALEPVRPAGSPSGPVRRRALVIDDENAVRDVLRRWLQRRGWEVDEASNGSLAIERLRPQCDAADTPAYDLIICDLRMPSLSGPELYAWAMINRPDVIGRLVFASGDVCDAGAADFLGRTGCPVLEKPFELRTLDDLVSRIAVSG